MKVPLKRHMNMFSKLRRRLSSARWALLFITTATFFFSIYLSSCGCDQQGNCQFSFSVPAGSSVQTPPLGNPVGAPSPASQPLTQLGAPTVPALVGLGSPPAVGASASSPAAAPPTSNGSPPTGGAAMQVMIIPLKDAAHPEGYAFSPATLSIKKGTTVTWVNTTDDEHDVNNDPGSPAQLTKSQLFGQGKTYSFTFSKTGTYKYHCDPHPIGMKATITVS